MNLASNTNLKQIGKQRRAGLWLTSDAGICPFQSIRGVKTVAESRYLQTKRRTHRALQDRDCLLEM